MTLTRIKRLTVLIAVHVKVGKHLANISLLFYQGKVGKITEMLKIFSVQNMEHPFETLRQKSIIIFIKNLLEHTTPCGNSNS